MADELRLRGVSGPRTKTKRSRWSGMRPAVRKTSEVIGEQGEWSRIGSVASIAAGSPVRTRDGPGSDRSRTSDRVPDMEPRDLPQNDENRLAAASRRSVSF